MAVLSNVARIAAQRSMHVYGFTHLCKKHQVSYGQPEDFSALPSVLREHPDFRSSVLRFAAAAMSSDQPLSLNEVAVALAVALGGLQIAAHQQLEVPDEFMAMLRSSLTLGESETAAEPGTLDAAPEPITIVAGSEPAGQRSHLRQATAAPMQLPTRHAPAALPFAQLRSAAPQAASDPSRRPPIFGQAVRADLPEDELARQPSPVSPATPAPGPELVAKVRHLASERQALQQRMQEVEERLTDAIQELGVLAEPMPPKAQPEARAQAEPQVRMEPSLASAAVPNQQLAPVPPVEQPQIPDSRQQQPVPFRASQPLREPRQSRAGVGSVSQQPPVHDLSRDQASKPPAFPLPSPRSPLLRSWPIALAVLVVLLLAAFLAVQHRVKQRPTALEPAKTADPQTAPASPLPSATAGSEPAPANPLRARAAKPSADIRLPAIPARPPQREINDTLARWATAAAHNDPAAESAFYAPSVDRYFLRRNVSRGYVLADKQAFRARGNEVGTFTISDVTTQSLSPSSAVVDLRKTWSVARSNVEGPLHSTRSRLWLRRGAQGWQITGEQDLTSAR